MPKQKANVDVSNHEVAILLLTHQNIVQLMPDIDLVIVYVLEWDVCDGIPDSDISWFLL